MTTTWTDEELKEFNRLIELSGSRDQMDRIHSRIEMPKFITKHGKEKCDAMWAFLESKPRKKSKPTTSKN